MNDLVGLLMNQLGGNTSDLIAKAIGTESTTAKKGIELALPLILNQLNKNAQDKDEATNIFNALDKHSQRADNDQPDLLDGAKILKHLFGGNTEAVEERVAKETNLDKSGAAGLLAAVANKVMGGLGQQKAQGGLDITNLIGLLGTSSKQATEKSSFANELIFKMMDQDGDGSIIDDAMNIGGKLLKGMLS